ncbi:carbohydrate-binding protein [Fibrobacter sp. UWEL]|uniref:carbohydrate-binding protein n=1 Tax=Fibrobacter sp. UWEL TaxID=1896209 RepID=UPI000923459B|nr:carbohydrate-binding protein [Fibrobacter sp. UWEL]SHK80422.1 Carbohydrate binding module (family 6) [Fibrobacter sp. UWEL]
MNTFKKVCGACLTAGLATFGLAYNPISTYHYLADPGAAADDEYFYIITDSDDPAPYNSDGYKIYALYGFRSKDMQNWTDFGIIYDSRQINGIGAIWASGIASDPKTGKLYIVFPDGGGGGIGYIKADGIEGPWTNAVGQGKSKLIGGSGIIGCDGVSWCFDPGIFIDDDGTTYVTWGGGESTSRPNTDNFDVVKLNDAKDAPVGNGSHVKVNGLSTRKMLEASYIHKHNKKYYFSYSTGWQQGAPTIDYGIGDSPMGPFTWKGTILGDPSMNGRSINGNNNHHGIAEFKGHSYVVYHDRRIAKGHDGLEIIPADDGQPKPNEGYHRSVSVDEMFYNADGTIKQVVCTNEGPEQIENFDPYDWYPALTSSKQKGVRSRSLWSPGKVSASVLLPLSTKESWIRVSGVDFGTGATGFTVEAASTADNNKIEIHKGSATGTLAGTCTLAKTSSKTTYAETKCDVDGLSGIVDQLFLVFKGSQDSTMAILNWGFEGSGTTPPTPQSTFGNDGKAWAIPGKIEAENFDVPGTGKGSDLKSYYDDDSDNHSCTDTGKEAECSKYRDGTGVDIYKKSGDKLVVGYIKKDEWLEYTVNVAEDGDYTMFAAVASDGGSSFKLSMDGKDITSDVTVPANKKGEDDAQNFDDYNKVSANVSLTKGEHILRFTATADWFDVDYFNFVKGKDAKDDAPIGGTDPVADPDTNTTVIGQNMMLNAQGKTHFQVFDIHGNKVADLFASSMADAAAMWQKSPAAEKVQGVNLIRNVATGLVSKVRSVR